MPDALSVNICGQDCLISPTLRTAHHCFLIFTGNPSFLSLYLPFVDGLLATSPTSSFLIASLHPTAPGPVAPKWNVSLSDCISIKTALLDYLIATLPQTTRFSLFTHSLGAYIALHALDLRPSFVPRLLHVVHIFPAIRDLKQHIDFTVRLIAHTTPCIPLISLVVLLLKLLPVPLFALFLSFVSTVPNHQASAVQREINPHHITQVASLTIDEEQRITTHAPAMQHVLRNTAHITTVVFGRNDRYTPAWVRAEFREQYPGIAVHETTIKHAFVLGQTPAMLDFLGQVGLLQSIESD